MFPDPFEYSTRLVVEMAPTFVHREAYIEVGDALGRAVARVPLQLVPGRNESMYVHRTTPGVFNATLFVDGRRMASVGMVAR